MLEKIEFADYIQIKLDNHQKKIDTHRSLTKQKITLTKQVSKDKSKHFMKSHNLKAFFKKQILTIQKNQLEKRNKSLKRFEKAHQYFIKSTVRGSYEKF